MTDWQTSAGAVFNPVNTTNGTTDYTIDAHFLLYETRNGVYKQANTVMVLTVSGFKNNLHYLPAIGANNTLQCYEMR